MSVVVEKIWLSEDEACIYTSLGRTTLRENRENGKITYRSYGRKIIYKRIDLDNFIERNTDLVKSVEDSLKDLKSKRKNN